MGPFPGCPCSVDGCLAASLGAGDALRGFIRAPATVLTAVCHARGAVAECFDPTFECWCNLARKQLFVGFALLSKRCFEVPSLGVAVSLLRRPVAICGRAVTFRGGLVAMLCRLLVFPRCSGGCHGPVSTGGIAIELRGLPIVTRGLIVTTPRLLVEPGGLLVSVTNSGH